MIGIKTVTERLGDVNDPELGMNIVDLGLVYNIRVVGKDIHIDISLTYPGCPLGPQIIEDIQKKVGDLAGAQKIIVRIVWEPAWQQAMMHPDTLEELRFLGRIR